MKDFVEVDVSSRQKMISDSSKIALTKKMLFPCVCVCVCVRACVRVRACVCVKILLTFRLFHYIWFIDSENLCFLLILKEKNDKVLTFNIVHVTNFEISDSL